MFGIGAQELVVIAVIAPIVFGPERRPALAAQLAKASRDVRRLSDELTGEFRRSRRRDDPAGPAIARSLRVATVPHGRAWHRRGGRAAACAVDTLLSQAAVCSGGDAVRPSPLEGRHCRSRCLPQRGADLATRGLPR